MKFIMKAFVFAAFLFAASNQIDAKTLLGDSKTRVPNLKFEFANGTYEISTSRASWVQAKNACKSVGMHLLTIENAEENNAVLEAIVLMPAESFWTAGTDLGHEGNFYWDATGHAIGPYTYWHPDEPDNADDSEHCIHLWGDGHNHLWNDADCGSENLYICEPSHCAVPIE